MNYLFSEAAVDVSRLTGLPWSWARVETGGDLLPCINLVELSWWDRWRVAWALIGGHVFADTFP